MRSKLFAIHVFLCIALCSSSAFAQNRAKVRAREIPKVLYHWISKDSINKPKKVSLVERGFLPLPRMYPSFNLVAAVPDLAFTKGLFVWNHPIGGMGTGPSEIYGDLGALIAIKTKDGIHNALELETENQSKPLDLKIDLRSIALIHHKHFFNDGNGRRLIFEEWVIKKPQIAAEFSADPVVLKPLIQEHLDFMRRGGQYADQDLHFKIPPNQRYRGTFINSEYAREQYLYPRLEAYLRLTPRDFHSSWRRPLSLCDEASLRFEIDP
jgi:hypothetical protein